MGEYVNVGKIYDCSMDAKQMFCYEVRDENGKIYEFGNDESSFEKSEDSHEEKERLVTGDVVIDMNESHTTYGKVCIVTHYEISNTIHITDGGTTVIIREEKQDKVLKLNESEAKILRSTMKFNH